jgi:hypothetical protein
VLINWQHCWNRSNTGRSTYDLLPVAGTKKRFPKVSCVAITYIRLLPNDTAHRAHQYKIGLVDTKDCECNQGVDDEYHFFFECPRYNDIRTQMIEVLRSTWLEAGQKGSPKMSVDVVLMPSASHVFTKKQCNVILSATFQFIQQSGRRL